MRKKLAFCFVLFCSAGYAQYIPLYSQYMFTESVYNPAYFGMDRALSVTALHRSHWMKLEGGPKTTFITAQLPLWNVLGFGVTAIDDSAGPLNRKTFQCGFAYHLNINDAKLSIGIMPGIQGLRMAMDKIKLSQTGDPSFVTMGERYFYPIVGYGLYFKNKHVNLGLSVPQMSLSKNENIEFETHYLGNLSYRIAVGNKVKFRTSVLAKYVDGSPLQVDVSEVVTFKDKIWIGASYRSFAVIGVMAGVNITPQIRIGFAYDYPLTIMNEYSQGNSEFLLNYTMYYDQPKVLSPRFF